MTRKPRPSPPDLPSRKVARPLDIIDAALELLDKAESTKTDNAGLPGPALPSLLARCEAVVGRAGAEAGGHNLLICADGLDVLAPEWWQRHAGGIGVQRLPVAPDAATLEAQLAAFERGERRQGRHALTLATLDEAPGAMRSFGTVRLLTWHPWASFVAAPRAMTLEAHCEETARLIDQVGDAPRLTLEDLGPEPVDQAAAIAASFDLDLPRRARVATPAPDRLVPPAEIDGGIHYQTLCARLGYAPDTVPLPPRAHSGSERRLPTLEALDRRIAAAETSPFNPAQISWFLPRLDRLGISQIVGRDTLRELVTALDGCLETIDFRQKLDPLIESMVPSRAALLLLLAGAHWARVGEKLIAMGLADEAMDLAPDEIPALRQLGASLYAELGQPKHAFHVAAGPLLAPGFLSEGSRTALLKLLYGETLKPGGEHGQDLLITHLQADPPQPANGRRRRLVEIGTTREAVPGQGSTRQLAELCDTLGLDFVTVDMDPENGRRAKQMFRRNGQSFDVVSGKGEEYLAQTEDPLDYVFLDAYDFDHGMHSEWRQSRYTQVLGDRISDEACHRMHLECAKVLVEKLAPDGLICFDDTWRDEEGHWTAKGKTAMPYLLEQGFEVIEARNRAALLRRKSAG